MPSKPTKETKAPSNDDHRESAENSRSEVSRPGKFWVVICRDGIVLPPNKNDAFSSDCQNIGEHAGNEPASCKTKQQIFEVENPGATAIASGVEDVVEGVSSSSDNNPEFSRLAMHPGGLA